MTTPLLDRQSRLLEYLTSEDAIFGDKHAPIDACLLGIDRGLLDLEARFSFEKRIEKIAAVFPATFDLLGADRHEILRKFARFCPPSDISRIENARQFHGFLCDHWRRKPPALPYIPDVGACEMACAQVRIEADSGIPETATADASGSGIRRSAGVKLLRTAFDIRAIFEGNSDAAPIERETLLAITPTSSEPEVYELTMETFDFLAALDEWTMLEDIPDADDLIADLVQSGLLERRR